MELLRPYMGQRRQDQIDRAIACYAITTAYPHRQFTIIETPSDEYERYWLAGYLEGEACFLMKRVTKACKDYFYPCVEVNSTDLDVIEHVQHLWQSRYGVQANIKSRQPSYEGSKTVYRIAVVSQKAQTIMADMYPLMGFRRQAKMQSLLAGQVG